MPDQPTVLGQNMASSALADPQFYVAMPEFRQLQPKLNTMRVNLSSRRGCRGCRERRVVRNLYGDFMSIVLSLTPEAMQRLKAYFGVGRLLVQAVDPRTRGVVPRIL